MKSNYSHTKTFGQLFLLLITVFLLKSCVQDTPTISANNSDIPELLQRNEKIQYGKEWDDVQNSYSDYKSAITKNDNDYEAKLKLAQLYIKEARVTGEHGHYYPAALKVLNSVLASDSIDNDIKFLALMTKSGVQLSLHDFGGAKLTGTEAVVLNPANAQIHGVLVDANVELGDYDKAVNLVDRMVQIKPDIRSYSRVAYLREIYGDIPGSIEALTMAVKSGYPGTEETAWAMQTLADLYAQYGEYAKAESLYNNILQMRIDYPFAVGGLGALYLKQGDNAKAEQTLDRAISIIPEVGFYVSKAELFKKENRVEELNKLIPDIFEMLKDDEQSGHNMNLEYVHIYKDILEDYDKALEYALMEYEKRPTNIDVALNLSEIYYKLGNKEKAKEMLKIASSTNSQKPELLLMKKEIM